MTSEVAPPKLPYPVIAEPSAMFILGKIQQFTSAWRNILNVAQVQELAEEYGGMDLEQKRELDRKIQRINPQYRNHVITMGQDVRPYQIWERYRETYEPHPALTRALVDMKADTRIPAGVLQRLHHPNPLFLLPGAPPITFADGHSGRVVALFVIGAVSKRRQKPGDRTVLGDDAPDGASLLLDTHDEDINAYHVMTISEVHDPTGKLVVDWDWCHLTMPVKEEFTLDELARVTVDGEFRWTATREPSDDALHAYLLAVSRIAVSHLLYACSRTVELDGKPRASRPPVKPKKGEPKPPASARMRRMGWKLGAAIEDSVRRMHPRTPGTGTGKSRAPHMRGAHLHTYLVGPGRQEVDIKWLDPIPVNMAKDDGVTVTRHRMR
jgi:hypothetical protein